MNRSIPFPCDQCGACCKNVHRAVETHDLDRGDGVCRHLDEQTNLCSIYNDRPEICRVDLQYELNYKQLYSWEQFIEINVASCDYLKKITP